MILRPEHLEDILEPEDCNAVVERIDKLLEHPHFIGALIEKFLHSDYARNNDIRLKTAVREYFGLPKCDHVQTECPDCKEMVIERR